MTPASIGGECHLAAERVHVCNATWYARALHAQRNTSQRQQQSCSLLGQQQDGSSTHAGLLAYHFLLTPI